MEIEHPSRTPELFQDIKPGEMFYDEHSNLYLKTIDLETENNLTNSVSINFVPGHHALFYETSPVTRVKKIKITG